MNTQTVTIIKEIAQPPISSVYLSDSQVAKRYGVSRQTVWRWANSDNTLPKPIKLSPGCTRWNLRDLENWEAAK
jgi:prophage regulatory protein